MYALNIWPQILCSLNHNSPKIVWLRLVFDLLPNVDTKLSMNLSRVWTAPTKICKMMMACYTHNVRLFLFYKRYTVLEKHNCCCWNEVEPFNIGVVGMFSYNNAINLLQYCNSLQLSSPVSLCGIFSFVACMHAKRIFFIHLCCPNILEKNCLQVCEWQCWTRSNITIFYGPWDWKYLHRLVVILTFTVPTYWWLNFVSLG